MSEQKYYRCIKCAGIKIAMTATETAALERVLSIKCCLCRMLDADTKPYAKVALS